MSATNRRPLARIKQDGVFDHHRDAHGEYRTTRVEPVVGGVVVHIISSDGREFVHLVRAKQAV